MKLVYFIVKVLCPTSGKRRMYPNSSFVLPYELGNYRTYELGNYRTYELGNYRTYELGNYRTYELGNFVSGVI